jgi:hypothetical protein
MERINEATLLREILPAGVEISRKTACGYKKSGKPLFHRFLLIFNY